MSNHIKFTSQDVNMINHTKDINMHNHIEDEKLSQEIQEVDAPFFGPESHTMNVSVATQCKSAEAGLVFSHVFFWIKNNKIREVNQINGRTWMYETIVHMQKFLPYLSDMQIKRALVSLVENGYLLKANYNKNKFDHTSWYALAREEWIDFKINFAKGQVRPIAESSTTQGEGKYDPSYKDKDKRTDKKKEDIVADATGISLFFLEKMKSINPKIKITNHTKWAKDIDLMIQEDGHTEQEIRRVIEYLILTKEKPSSNGFSWANIVISPEKLRKHFPQIWGEMLSTQADSSAIHRAIAQDIQDKYSTRMDINHSTSYIEFINGVTSQVIKFGDKKFKEKVIEELKKRNLTL